MKIDFTFRHMDSSERLKSHTSEKLERLARFEDREMNVHVTFGNEKYNSFVEFQVNGTSGMFVSSEVRQDMHEAIDLAVDKLDRQLARDKDKRKRHKGLQASTPR
jgi:putative sigma-54 modulation protein